MQSPAIKEQPDVTDLDLGAMRTISFNKEACDRIKAMSDDDFRKSKHDFPDMAFILDYIRERET